MSPYPILSIAIDEDTQLRLLEQRHADEYHELTMRNRAHQAVWMPWAAEEESVEQTRAYLKHRLLQFANGKGFLMGLWYQGQVIGSLGFHDLDWADKKVEIGYWIDAASQGKGLITKACRVLVTYAFQEYGLNKVEIHCATGNTRSRAVAERLGFTQEGTIRQAARLADSFVDHVIYGMLASEWEY